MSHKHKTSVLSAWLGMLGLVVLGAMTLLWVFKSGNDLGLNEQQLLRHQQALDTEIATTRRLLREDPFLAVVGKDFWDHLALAGKELDDIQRIVSELKGATSAGESAHAALARMQAQHRQWQSGKSGQSIYADTPKIERAFSDFEKASALLSEQFAGLIAQKRQLYRTYAATALVLLLLLGGVIALALIRRIRENHRHVESLDQANRTIAQKHRELKEILQFDNLTSALSRSFLTQQLESTCKALRTQGGAAAVLYVDFERFSRINDQFGHARGDALLKECAKRLRDCTRDGDLVGRVGGDEFVILLKGFDAEEEAQAGANRVAKAVLAAFREPFKVDRQLISLGLSIGISLGPCNGVNAEDLISCADQAMYEVKRAGANLYRFHSAELRERILRDIELEGDLHAAIEENQFELRYQPQFNLRNEHIVGVEALLSWNRNGERISPSEFIPVATRSGLITKIDQWVVRNVLRQWRRWQAEKLSLGLISLNISPVSFAKPEFLDWLEDCFAKHDAPPSDFELELTECTLIADNQHSQRSLRKLREMGFSVAIDDFGAGYSSMSYLKSFAVDTLKIDKSFVTGASDEASVKAILQNMVALGVDLSLRVIAEGVETEEDLALVIGAGCHIGQGFKWSRPLRVDELRELLTGKPAVRNNVVSLEARP